MKPYYHLFSASLAVLALAACSPSTPASDASASVSETAAETVAAVDTADTGETVTDSEASSAATVVVTQAETYDPLVIKEMGQKPGYWELKHTDPKTKKSYTTHVCVDKPLANRMTNTGPVTAPADRRDYKTDANFKGVCPTGVKGGDVERSDGNRVNAYGDRKTGGDRSPGQDSNNKPGGQDARGNDRSDQRPSAGNDQGPVSVEPSRNPHTTPAEDHANDRPVNGHDSSTSRLGENRG
jgi:hypothetical protein